MALICGLSDLLVNVFRTVVLAPAPDNVLLCQMDNACGVVASWSDDVDHRTWWYEHRPPHIKALGQRMFHVTLSCVALSLDAIDSGCVEHLAAHLFTGAGVDALCCDYVKDADLIDHFRANPQHWTEVAVDERRSRCVLDAASDEDLTQRSHFVMWRPRPPAPAHPDLALKMVTICDMGNGMYVTPEMEESSDGASTVHKLHAVRVPPPAAWPPLSQLVGHE